jgi:putative phosphoribosyl transferase
MSYSSPDGHRMEFATAFFTMTQSPKYPPAYAANIPSTSSKRTFRDRREAGRVLAGLLAAKRGRPGVIVLGLARGGVPVGWEIAAALQAPLDVFLVRKLGVPNWPELAMGAIASGGGLVVNDHLIRSLGITSEQLDAVVRRETDELHRRETAYRGGDRVVDLGGREVILVDDGIATGASMIAALRAVKATGPARVIVAVPVGPRSAYRRLRDDADEVLFAVVPDRFEAVGQVFADFHQVSDDEVRAVLATPTVPSGA